VRGREDCYPLPLCDRLLQSVAVCCSVLQCAAVCGVLCWTSRVLTVAGSVSDRQGSWKRECYGVANKQTKQKVATVSRVLKTTSLFCKRAL